MHVFIETLRYALFSFVALYGVGWLVFFSLLMHRVFSVLLGGLDLQSAVTDPKLIFLRKFLFRMWVGALVSGLLAILASGFEAFPVR